ncbi:hypothetical protein ABW19_dt0201536 [Dactylella cylindrospora]|nr:hypothetical protein ABW19_dt0201536 [Dactylella cylindrospora]
MRFSSRIGVGRSRPTSHVAAFEESISGIRLLLLPPPAFRRFDGEVSPALFEGDESAVADRFFDEAEPPAAAAGLVVRFAAERTCFAIFSSVKIFCNSASGDLEIATGLACIEHVSWGLYGNVWLCWGGCFASS